MTTGQLGSAAGRGGAAVRNRDGTPPLVLHVFPTFAVGGAQVRFCALANRYGQRWRHAVVALDGRYGAAERLGPGVMLDRVASPARHGQAARNVPRIRSLLRELRPDVLVTSNWGSIEWAMGNMLPPRRVRHLHMEDGFGPEESAAQLPRRVLARRLVLRGSTVVLPSRVLVRAATEIWRLPSAGLRYIPNGLDLRRFRPDGPVDRFPVPGEGPVIGTVAALRPEKNVARLLRAAALLLREGAKLRLLVVGDGPDRAHLEQLAGELGISGSALFTGHAADPAAAYRGMDLFALSSDTEQMPFSVLEAMASGLPVASTDVGDVGVMLAAENAPYVCISDDASMSGALRALLHDAGLRTRLGTANRARAVSEFDQEAMFQSYAALLDGVRQG